SLRRDLAEDLTIVPQDIPRWDVYLNSLLSGRALKGINRNRIVFGQPVAYEYNDLTLLNYFLGFMPDQPRRLAFVLGITRKYQVPEVFVHSVSKCVRQCVFPAKTEGASFRNRLPLRRLGDQPVLEVHPVNRAMGLEDWHV